MTFRFSPALATALLATALGSARAAPVEYVVDPTHTYPSFEADHMGMSTWRGKFNTTTGTLWLDKAAGSGTVDLKIDVGSIDFGLAQMNSVAKDTAMFNVAEFPYAFYKGRLEGFAPGDTPRVVGTLDFRGVTRPLTLEVARWKCQPHPLSKRDWCGADAQATFSRDAWGFDVGRDWGFSMATVLRIQVEAVARD
ncbi:YceI family protein [Leptothrix discophora]|uniref:YceI family protein n=1 Tax=Leptothrix discophora TaxID=89 RepID=A0ABT9G2D5_LEPDI|nr:YceI family protein [Leptothrix discophora]MDP4300649.1 YceI family protein [Leptothrix discophora]